MQTPFSTDRRQRGIALISVLWLSVLLALIATAANRVSRTDVALAANTRAAYRAQQAAESATEIAIFIYMTGEDGAWYADGTPYGWLIDDFEVRVSMTDERWRLDLNAGSEAALSDMFSNLGESDDVAAGRAAEVTAYREAARTALGGLATEAQLQQSGFFAFGIVEEIRMATEMDDRLAGKISEVATVYTGMPTPRERPALSVANAAADEDATLTDRPLPLRPLAESPPERTNILRIQAEARTAEGATFAREVVVVLDEREPQRPYSKRLLRRSEQRLFPAGE